ncbi:MAG: hypothetical protein QOI15_804 [Pseudonocardiales bacterium]|jgi:hypothetical protein|nr:hypothetical protein [Pseudonocardiales bacterium]MDT4919902.1 hypothetical protein [Pseudonocardiales bacterium]MDT4941394.1 hypothetical protein [Pseudonocardiales bacterium]
MTVVLRCECGFTVRAGDEHHLIREAQRHALDAHRMALSAEQILCAAFEAELAAGPRPTAGDAGPTSDGE